jgi:hypothetical protein
MTLQENVAAGIEATAAEGIVWGKLAQTSADPFALLRWYAKLVIFNRIL